MQNQAFFELSLELFEFSELVRSLVRECFGVEINCFSSLAQVVSAQPEQLDAYLEALKNRLDAYIQIIKVRYPQVIEKIEIFSAQLVAYKDLKIDNSKLLDPGKTQCIEAILENLTVIAKAVNSQGYVVRAYSAHNIKNLFLCDLEMLDQLRLKTLQQRTFYSSFSA